MQRNHNITQPRRRFDVILRDGDQSISFSGTDDAAVVGAFMAGFGLCLLFFLARS